MKSDPLVAVSEMDLLVCIVPFEHSLLSHPVAPEDELVQIGRYVYLMPYAPFATPSMSMCSLLAALTD